MITKQHVHRSLVAGGTGLSAYEVAVANGFVGTQEAWLASLAGPAGAANTLEIGTVTTGEPGSEAAAALEGEAPNQSLSLTIPAGLPGTVPPAASVVAGASIVAGQPVFVSLADGKLYPAEADIFGSATVIGLARAATAAGFVCDVEGISLTLEDWTAIVGSAGLSRGATYFLSVTPGQLTTAAPTSRGDCVTVVGVATGAQTMAVGVRQPILL